MLGKRILTLTSGSDHFFQFMVSAAWQASRKYELRTAHTHALSIDVLEDLCMQQAGVAVAYIVIDRPPTGDTSRARTVRVHVVDKNGWGRGARLA
jgi:hypothetical protein